MLGREQIEQSLDTDNGHLHLQNRHIHLNLCLISLHYPGVSSMTDFGREWIDFFNGRGSGAESCRDVYH